MACQPHAPRSVLVAPVAVTSVGTTILGDLMAKAGLSLVPIDEHAAQQVLENNLTYQVTEWISDTHHAAISLTPVRTFKRGNVDCRDYQTALKRPDAVVDVRATACRTPSGFWQLTR